jgi:GTPase
VSTPELTRSLAVASFETGRQVGALVHRSGKVDYVVVGDANKLMLPDIGRLRAAEGRFRGLRLVHTHVRGEPLTRDDLVDLVRLRLDLVCAIQLGSGGEGRTMHVAYNVPADDGELPYRAIGPLPIGQLHLDVGELMTDLEAAFARRHRARDVRAKDGRAILVHVSDKSERRAAAQAAESMRELRELARTAGVEVADTIVQLRDRVDPKLVLGKGKLDDVIVRAMQLDADVLVFDRELTPAQSSAIAKESDLKIVDRTQLILDIFAQRAESKDGKLQVELAQLKYNMPRLAQRDDSLSRLTGGIGGRGPGETKIEIGRRRAKERVAHLEAQLRTLARQRQLRRHKRTRIPIPTVAIVGYTNAGKSTLLNALTGADVLAEDRLFATLDTRSRHLALGHATSRGHEIVITDTVGFIRNLPKDLFAAFRATFEEAADADLIVHVVDAYDDAKDEHMATTEAVLETLGLDAIPRVLVFNKVELLPPLTQKVLQRRNPEAVLVSALDRDSTRPLVARIVEEIAGSTAPEAEPVDPRQDRKELEASTLEDLLAFGRRPRKARRASPRPGAPPRQ